MVLNCSHEVTPGAVINMAPGYTSLFEKKFQFTAASNM